MNPSKNQAINCALEGSWDEAIKINLEILKDDPEDIDSLNRLGFAYLSICDFKNAKKTYEKVLKIDEQNNIAHKNLKRISDNPNTNTSSSTGNLRNTFLEEHGKTKVIDLINVAEQKTLDLQRCGQVLKMEVKRMRIHLSDSQNRYIGTLPDDISLRLTKFLESGNEYEAYVKTISQQKVTVFIRETKRSKKNINIPSFINYEPKTLRLDQVKNGKI